MFAVKEFRSSSNVKVRLCQFFSVILIRSSELASQIFYMLNFFNGLIIISRLPIFKLEVGLESKSEKLKLVLPD